jgi:hypothetical protein
LPLMLMPSHLRARVREPWPGQRVGIVMSSRGLSYFPETPYLTMTTLFPVRTSLDTMEARRPIRWPRASTTTALGDMPGILQYVSG